MALEGIVLVQWGTRYPFPLGNIMANNFVSGANDGLKYWELIGVDRTPGSSAVQDPRRWDLKPCNGSCSKLPPQGHDLDTHHNMWRRTRATSRCAEQQHTGYNPHGTTHPPRHDPVRPRNAGRTRSRGWHRKQKRTGSRHHGSTPPTAPR